MEHEEFLGNGLKVRLYIYIALCIGIIALITYHIVLDSAGIILPIVALLIGAIAGIGFSRIYQISWDENAGKVISRLDAYGAIILAVYACIEIFREKIVEHFVHGPAVAATSLSLLGGLLIGRILGMRRKIRTEVANNA